MLRWLLVLVVLSGVVLGQPSYLETLERKVQANGSDEEARRELLRVYWNAIPMSDAETKAIREKRLTLILWIIQNAPAWRFAGEPEALIGAKGAPLANEEDFERFKQAWLTAAEENRNVAAVQGNAGKALLYSSPSTAATFLRRALELEPGEREYAFILGATYANALADQASKPEEGFAIEARQALETTLDPRILRMSGQVLKTRATFGEASQKAVLDELAERYLARARSLQPDSEYGIGVQGTVTRGIDLGRKPLEDSKVKMPEMRREIATVDIPPQELQKRLLFHPRPSYPEEAQRAGITGLVRVEVLVAIDGAVIRSKAVSGPALLRNAAEEAVRNWTFQPLEQDGQKAEMRSTVDLEFRLPTAPAGAPKR